jgi:hypothetical protein
MSSAFKKGRLNKKDIYIRAPWSTLRKGSPVQNSNNQRKLGRQNKMNKKKSSNHIDNTSGGAYNGDAGITGN